MNKVVREFLGGMYEGLALWPFMFIGFILGLHIGRAEYAITARLVIAYAVFYVLGWLAYSALNQRKSN